jgi:molybdopterin synthase catalytic subunit
MRVKVLAFAGLKWELGPERWVELPEGATVQTLLGKLAEEHPALRGQLEVTAVAVGDRLVDEHHQLKEGEEVALLPPVSGG